MNVCSQAKSNDGIEFYLRPNPTITDVELICDSSFFGKRATIFNQNSEPIGSFTIDAKRIFIPMVHLEKGFYYLLVEDRKIIRIVKQ